MKNTRSICELCEHLSESAHRIGQLVTSSDIIESAGGQPNAKELYDDMWAAELEFSQKAILMLTDLLLDSGEREDESAFAAGELNDVKKGTPDMTGIPDEEEEEKE